MKAIIKAAEWTLGPETAEGAPKEPMYEAECTTCMEQSGATEGERLPAEVWALKHTGLNPAHRTYRAIITSFWRVEPAEGNPYREPEGAVTEEYDEAYRALYAHVLECQDCPANCTEGAALRKALREARR